MNLRINLPSTVILILLVQIRSLVKADLERWCSDRPTGTVFQCGDELDKYRDDTCKFFQKRDSPLSKYSIKNKF